MIRPIARRGLAAALLAVAGAATAAGTRSLASGPFAGVPLDGLPQAQREAIVAASEDFEAVRAGRAPVHAKLDRLAALPADGGTEFFVGSTYRLTIEKSLSAFGGLQGYLYGPILSFDEGFAPGNEQRISDTRFYTAEQLNRLLAK
jgi:hypothetical protein